MARLHSVQLCGIRSFSPESNETITFNSPVTLFLGHNGCGKTTIVESICYSLCGELPSGSSNGQGFLNDPKMSHKRSTKGSIKIKFLDCLGNMLTVSRSMTVTMKPDGKLTFKSLDTTIRQRDKNDPNNPKDISGRCLDTDSYCTSALNVSKSIINNVLFCHQENSSWPLDESKKLKEKFDQIFDATRYNKCIENIRKQIKNEKSKSGELRAHLGTKQNIKDQADKLKAKCSERKEKLEEVVDKIANKSSEMTPIEKRMKEILELEDCLGTLQSKLSGKQTEKKGVIEQQATIRKHINDIFKGSDEELQNKIDSFQVERNSENDVIKEMEQSKDDLNLEIQRLNQTIQKRQLEIGQLREEKKQYQNKIVESNDMIEKLRVALKLNEFTNLNDKVSVIKNLKNAVKLSEENFKIFEENQDINEKELQKQIDEARVKFARTNENIAFNEKSILECNLKVRDITSKLDDLDTSDSQLKIIEDKIEKLQAEMTKYKESFNETEKLQEIDELKEDIRKKEQDLEKLEKEFRLLQRNYATEQKLESQKSLVIEKQGEITKIKNKHLERFQKLFDYNIPQKHLRKSVDEIHSREENKYKQLTSSINILENEIARIQTKLNMNKKMRDDETKELENLKKKVSNLCEDKPFKTVLEETYNKKERLQKEIGLKTAGKVIYDEFARQLEKDDKSCCPVCQTDFSQKKHMIRDITATLRAKVASIPSELEGLKINLKRIEDYYNKLQQLKPVNNQIETLTGIKIPKLEAELTKLNDQFEDKTMELVSEKENIKHPQDMVKICKEVTSDAALLDQYSADIVKANLIIEELNNDIIEVPSKRSRQEAEAEIESIKSQSNILKNRLDSGKEMLDSHRDRCQNLNKDIQIHTQKQIDMQLLMNEKPLLEKEKKEYTKKLVMLNEKLEHLGFDKVSQEQDLKSIIEQHKNVVRNNKILRQEEQKTLTSHLSLLDDIEKVQRDLNQCEKNNCDEKLNTAVKNLAEVEVRKDTIETSKNDITENISRKKQSLAQKDVEFRSLSDNVLLRDRQKMEEKLDVEIKELKKQIGDYNYCSIFEEKQKLERRLEKEKREINLLTGQKDEINKQIKELERDINLPQHKNAYNEYKKHLYTLKLNQLTIEDLSQYVNALEHSVLKFHEERMVQINSIIRDLWRSIYRGNDIDYIEIKTDSSVGACNKRVYNYKVVQVKNNVELEMRGRCSAGQKVLACLVIRMALAETFSTNCGILALDEPTTNLDRENILSLSDALSRIITARENERTFQLLIITHDEEFLNTLTRVQSLDSYYKVSRNQNGFSVIEKHYL